MDFEDLKFSDLHEGRTIIHVVGGRMNDDLAKNIGQIAQWFVDNDITLLWGDDYCAQFDENHPVKVLADEIKARGGNAPIRILQLGTEDYNQMIASHDRINFVCRDVLDDNGDCIGALDTSVKDQIMIYTDKQQNRQMLYYNDADALMALDGGIGASYEVTNSIIYGFSGDVPVHFKTIVIDNPDMPRYVGAIEAYLRTSNMSMSDLPQLCYFPSAKMFVDSVKNEITTQNEDEDDVQGDDEID